MKVSVVIISFNTRDMLERCLGTIFNLECKHALEVFCVDNASVDGSADMVAERFPQVHLIRNNINNGFAPSCNQVVDLFSGEYLLILNSDAQLSEKAIDSMVEYLEKDKSVGIAGAQLLEEDGTESISIRKFPSIFDKLKCYFRFLDPNTSPSSEGKDYDQAVDADWVTGAFLFVRRALINSIGLYDDRFFFYFDEADLCKRAWKNGWKVKLVPWVKIPHLDGGSGKIHGENFNKEKRIIENFFSRSEKLYFRKHYGVIGIFTLVTLEIVVCGVKLLKNIFSLSPERYEKKKQIKRQFKVFFEGLVDTKFGSFSPPPPW